MRRSSRAFTFIEVMVSVVLLALIGYGMVKIYVSIIDGRKVLSTMADIQSRGQVVLVTLSHYIRQAGDASCVKQQAADLKAKSLRGYSARNVPLNYGIQPLLTSDVIVVGECASIHGHRQYQYFAFYVGDTGRRSAIDQPIPALYKKRLGGRAVELVSGVDALRFAYGLASANDTDINQYVDQSRVKNWADVKSVQVSMNLESTDPEMQSIQGSRFYKVWHSYITVANRVSAP